MHIILVTKLIACFSLDYTICKGTYVWISTILIDFYVVHFLSKIQICKYSYMLIPLRKLSVKQTYNFEKQVHLLSLLPGAR